MNLLSKHSSPKAEAQKRGENAERYPPHIIDMKWLVNEKALDICADIF